MPNGSRKRNLVPLADAAEYYGVCTKTIRRRIAEGAVVAYRLPGASRLIRVDLDELDAALAPIPNGAVMSGAA